MIQQKGSEKCKRFVKAGDMNLQMLTYTNKTVVLKYTKEAKKKRFK